jgi:hypothetical protein
MTIQNPLDLFSQLLIIFNKLKLNVLMPGITGPNIAESDAFTSNSNSGSQSSLVVCFSDPYEPL